MAFSEDVKTKAMISCGRYCCICHKFCGNNMEVHHIKAQADGGDNSFENAIPLCFDCHAIVRQYDPRHPKGIKFSEKELIQHRDVWYKHIQQGNQESEKQNNSNKVEPIKIYHQKGYEDILLHKVSNGKEILKYLIGAYGIVYDEEAETLEEVKLVGDFLQGIKELLDFEDQLDEPCDRIMTAFNLTESIKKIEEAGFWVFVGKEDKVITGGIKEPEICPTLLLRVVRKDSSEIIKVNFEDK